jgi:CrcB protein
MTYFLIGLGGALGSIARFWLGGLIGGHRIGQTFPTGTLVVNIIGSFVIGFIAAMSAPEGRFYINPMARQFLMIGVCGGYTTFSSFSLQTLNLAQDGEWLYAGANILASVALCLVAVWLGHLCAEALNRS